MDEEGNKVERPMELVHDKTPSPEAAVLAVLDQERCRELVEQASAKVEDPRQLEAIRLYFYEDLPIISVDPERDSVAKRLGATEGQVKRLLANGLKCMRKALGGQQ